MRECRKCYACYPDEVLVCPADASETRLTLLGGLALDGRYLLKQRLGSGAMGQVYLAIDSKLETRKVAVKILKQDILDSEHLQENEAILRFEREAKAAASLNHPHIVAVSDYGKARERENVFYIVMEYVEGETLHKLLRREGTLTIKRAVNLLKQIVAGVGAAHAVGILHRDLKPGNIFLLQNAHGFEDGFIKVGDFGLAKLLDVVEGKEGASGPNSRGIIGTPEFMAPEQIDSSSGRIDVRADIYAIGTIAYLMLGGRCPFVGDVMQILTQKVNPYHQTPPLSSLRSDIPKKIEEVIMWAIEREVDKRPKSVGEWIRALGQAAEGIDEKRTQKTKLVILAPQGAEVYINDERKGTVGNSERLILSDVPVGRHVLRISKSGSKDDERVIEVRDDVDEQVIQAQLREASQKSSGRQSIMPGVVACTQCGARFAEGVRFCGKCGNSSFEPVALSSSKVFCKRCSSINPVNANFCGTCGFPIEKNSVSLDLSQGFPERFTQGQKVCSRCSKVYPATVKFCGKCGISL
jgi:serine/threonine protein kinase